MESVFLLAFMAFFLFSIEAAPVNICVTQVKPNAVCYICNSTFAPSSAITGFDIEIFRRVATAIGWTEAEDYKFVMLPTITDVTQSVALDDGTCYAGVGGISVTAALENEGIIFSYPYYRGALAVLVPSLIAGNSLWSFMEVFDVGLWLALFFTTIAVAMFLWVLEKRHLRHQIEPFDIWGMWKQSMGMFLVIDRFTVISVPSRIIALAYAMLVMILSFHYIGNLVTYEAVVDITSSIQSVTQLTNTTVATFQPFAERLTLLNITPFVVLNFSSNPYEIVSHYADLLAQGAVSAIAVDGPTAANYQFFDDSCSTIELGQTIGSFDYSIAFAHSVNQTLLSQFDTSIINLINRDGLSDLFNIWLSNDNPNCIGNGYATTVVYVAGITYRMMSGLWIILGGSLIVGYIGQSINSLLWRRGNIHLKKLLLRTFLRRARDVYHLNDPLNNRASVTGETLLTKKGADGAMSDAAAAPPNGAPAAEGGRSTAVDANYLAMQELLEQVKEVTRKVETMQARMDQTAT